VKSERDELSVALEGLRNRPVVTESRDYARHWERTRARAASLRRNVFGFVVTGVIACVGYFALPILTAAPRVIEARVGETRALTLSDGSRMVLDSGSQVKVAFSATTRDIELLQGQGHFEVAPDARRPFRVHTRAVEVVAVGTAFDVSTLPTRTTVTLIEGRVNVRAIAGTAAQSARLEMLTPGQQLGIDSDGQLLDRKEVKIASVTAWQQGSLVIDDAPLTEALAIMNRYSNTRIVVQGTALQSRRVSGVFRVGDVETESLVLQRYFGLKEIAHSADEIVLSRE
jgi:transmembrane sensor